MYILALSLKTFHKHFSMIMSKKYKMIFQCCLHLLKTN